jgi:LPXTG-motif cell wall-anchored protein
VKRILGVVFVALMISVPATAGAGQLGTQIPANCVAHTSFDGGADLRDDYRCAGLAIEFHTAGVAYSPGPIWAGQWLFIDESGQFRVGSCTFNRGIHPNIDSPSALVAQQFPNDPTGAKGAYLTWKYGDTPDDVTAAGMWAVFHYYAQDGAGTRRAANGAAALVPSLGMIAAASGRDDIQAMAIALDADATRFAGDWAIAVTLGVDGSIDVTLAAGPQPVADATVTLLISGQDSPTTVKTDASGAAHATVPVAEGAMTVVASATAPGLAAVYRGSPAGPDPQGAQRLVTGGPPRTISSTATVAVPPAPTTTSTTTTTVPETTTTTTAVPETTTTTTTTTVPETTSTTVPETTSTTITSTVPPTTLELPPDTTTTIPATTTTSVIPTTTLELPPDTTVPVAEVLPPVPGPPLPRTGKGSDLIAYLGTSLLVAGIGIVGVAGRRRLGPEAVSV